MRKRGFVVLGVLLLIVVALIYFVRDRYVERLIERAGENIAGARVELDRFHFSVWDLSFSWQRLQVADRRHPMRNILETGPARFSLQPRPLFWRRINIETLRLENVRSSSPRTTDGSLPAKMKASGAAEDGWLAKLKEKAGDQLALLPSLDVAKLGKKLDLEAMIDVNTLQSVQGYATLRREADSTFAQLQRDLDLETYRQRAQALESEIAALDLANLQRKNALQLAQTLKQADAIYKKIKSLRKELGQKQKRLESAAAKMNARFADLRRATARDVAYAQKLARLETLNVKNIGLILFGAPLLERIDALLGIVERVRKAYPMVQRALSSGKEEKPPRFAGQDIRFPFRHPYPRFLVRNLILSGATKGGDTTRAFFVSGEVHGITNDPQVYGRPLEFQLALSKYGGNTYKIAGVLDRTAATPRDSIRISAENFRLGEMPLSHEKYLPRAMRSDRGALALQTIATPGKLDLDLTFTASPVFFDFSSASADKISRIIRDVLTGIRKIELHAALSGAPDGTTFSIDSNVNQVLAARVRQVLDQEFRAARQQIASYVRTEAGKKRRDAEAFVQNKRSQLSAQFAGVQAMVDEQMQTVEAYQKEIEKRIKKKREGVLKNLFQKKNP